MFRTDKIQMWLTLFLGLSAMKSCSPSLSSFNWLIKPLFILCNSCLQALINH